MISVEHLTKRYGAFTAVDDISFEIEEGHVYGFLGPNGAGKSTTMNIMTGCLSPTDGCVRIDGHDILEEPMEAKKLLGYLPEMPPLYMNETPEEYLRFVGEAKGIKGDKLKAQIEEVIEKTRIGDVRRRRIAALSKGYKQRVGVAQAILGSPKVIILDEPTVGLDPLQIIEIRQLIKELGESHTVILSSHILSEVQEICDQVLIISKGKLVAFDDPKSLEKKLMTPNEINITTDATEDEIRSILSDISHISNISIKSSDGHSQAVITTDTTDDTIYEISSAVSKAFADNGKALMEISLKKANLEDIFIELTEADEKEAAQMSGAGSPDEKHEDGAQAQDETGESDESGVSEE